MPHPPLPATWTPIAWRDTRLASLLFWRFADGWDQRAVDDLRDAGLLLTAQRRGADGVMVLVARAGHGAARPAGSMRRGLSDAGRDAQRVTP